MEAPQQCVWHRCAAQSSVSPPFILFCVGWALRGAFYMCARDSLVSVCRIDEVSEEHTYTISPSRISVMVVAHLTYICLKRLD